MSNRANTKNEYPMYIADMLINNASENRIINFLDGNIVYNQIFMTEEDASKTTFIYVDGLTQTSLPSCLLEPQNPNVDASL